MQLDDFRVLSVLSQELNMRKAAERLFVSQPALSQRLQSLEKQWGTQLFIRSQKGLTITPEGEKVAAYAAEMLRQEESLRNELTSLQTKTHGTLKIAVASLIGQYWLPALLKSFVESYPLVQISLFTGWSSEVLKAFYEGDVHIAIVRGSHEYPGKKVHLFTEQLYLADTEISDLSMLEQTNKPFIQFKSDSTYYVQIQNWWHEMFAQPPQRTIVVDQIETCKQMVQNGIGYAILPATVLQGAENVHKLSLTAGGKQLTRETWMLANEASLKLKQVSAFAELVRNFVQK
ncbi:LysR family transcriptional regulator [Ectobacillus ponti]|uniref:LysR family transcriptional regulator n=1 Tax=Ectobacillus ponti TaxID=2961894 RepID=A0AA41X8J8_9BACI|nr:LysR family transcriptional regulator [Ectobacillus ponti]MCP8970889.1 LysR family transcriptional regulator [Ectobacillus ponti]